MDAHSGFYFPPAASKDRAVNSMEINDFIILWTYSQWRQAIVVIPPLSPERETCCILSVNQLLHACLLTKWKKCNILSLFLQIHIVESTIPRRSSVPLSLQKGAAYGMLPICKAFVCLPFYKRSFHIPLQSPWGLHNPMNPGSYRPVNLLIHTDSKHRLRIFDICSDQPFIFSS